MWRVAVIATKLFLLGLGVKLCKVVSANADKCSVILGTLLSTRSGVYE